MIRGEYLKYYRELKNMAKEAGARVRVYHRPLKLPTHYGPSGSYDIVTRTIRVTVYGNVARRLILAVLAHEVRHAQHHKLGIFADYYSGRYMMSAYTDLAVSGLAKAPDLKVAVRAERNCDTFAQKWLLSKGIPLDPKKVSHQRLLTKYPASSTCVWRLYYEIKCRIKALHLKDQNSTLDSAKAG